MIHRRPRALRLLAVLLGSIAALITATHAQQQADEPFVPGELIVQFRENVTETARRTVRETYGTSVSRRYDTLRAERLTIPQNANPAALARALLAHPEVEAAQPNFIRHKTSVGSPNDPYFVSGQLWGLPKISAPLAWSSFGAGATDAVVADIDTGVNYNHPDLAANMWRNPGEIAGNGVDDDSNGYADDVYGIDTANNDSNPIDDEGHGTHTSGTIGAVSDNGIGVAAVAPRVRILACKFIDSRGSGSDADAIECFNYVVALKQRGVNVRVTSNSWGALRGQFFPQALKNAIDAAGAAGIVNIFAAGNNGVNIDSTPFDPASFTSASIVSVAASDSADARASFSNYGAVSVDLAAPGVNILSTYETGYAFASGTSMATPHVAGAAAMLLANRPALTVAEVKSSLLNSADLLGSWTGLVATGGRLNLFQTLQIAPGGGGGGGPVNVAAAAAGATATASSSFGAGYAPASANNGERSGLNWGSGGGWNDATANGYPDWLQIDFSANKTISGIDVFTVQDTFSAPGVPTQTMTFTQYGVRDFEVQYWTGAAWQTIPGGAVTSNSLVWRRFTFAPITTPRIRVLVTGALASYSRITELEAWGTDAAPGNTPPAVTLTAPVNGATFTAPASITLTASASDADGAITSVTFYANGSPIGSDAAGPYTLDWTSVPAGSYSLTAVAVDDDGATATSNPVSVTVNPAGGGGLVNVAASAAGATASASSTHSSGYAPGAANNGDRRGTNWGAGGGWNDATSAVYPDWLQIDFSGSKSISALDVFSVQDAYSSPSEPTQAMTFTLYGLRDFEAQYWNGAAWQTIPGTVVTGNNLVWRHFAFTPITTSRIRILVSNALAGFSRITEIEAWADSGASGNMPPSVALTSPADGSTFVAPVSLTVAASASDADGTVSSVTFYANGSPLGSDAVGPYTIDWNNVPAGSYSLTAVAVDDDGAATTSTPVTVTVSPSGGGGPVNVAAAAAGAVASATSSYSAAYPPAATNDGDRLGVNWGAGGGWNDGTAGTYPDMLQIDFSASKTISEVDVFTVQDTYWAPAVPTAAMTFTQLGIRDFEVQYWNGSAWQTIPGTVMANNDLVWRRFTFAPITTPRIRVVVSNALASFSRIVEVEAY
ncbi:MAG TPA: S8 family serine peptidase [Vicinamibacterales bacterium]|nr:S8 family serine peptidase [Vicinamibacterales bacterium]